MVEGLESFEPQGVEPVFAQRHLASTMPEPARASERERFGFSIQTATSSEPSGLTKRRELM